MKKIFLLLFLLTCLLSFNFANAGVNETGSSSISLECKKTMLKKYQSDLSVSKSEGKNFLMYASVTENDCVWYQTWPKKEVSKKDHKYAFKKCTKEAKKNKLKTDCFIFAVNDKIVWKNFDKQVVLASKDAPLEKKISYLEDDKKPGRFFKDQPDINHDYQVHFIYLLGSEGKDREWDINGKMAEDIEAINNKFFKMTGNKQKWKIDRRKDGKIDISFVRLDAKANSRKGWNMQYPDFFLTSIGFNNPKKTYFAFVDEKHRDGGMAGAHHGYIFLKSNIGSNNDLRRLITLHELVHTQGPAWACNKTHSNGHTARGVVGLDPSWSLKYIYGDVEKGCPDLKDSVYMTPTVENPYDPIQIVCAMAQNSRGILSDYNFSIPEKYNHKKLLKFIEKKKDSWCTLDIHKYADAKWFRKWLN